MTNKSSDLLTPELLKQARINSKMTLSEIGVYFGITTATWRRWENGVNAVGNRPTVESFVKRWTK